VLQKKWVLALMGAGLLVVGMAGGVVVASGLNASASHYATPGTSSGNAYCQLYLNTVASKLGTTSAKLIAADQAGIQAVLDQMVKDGKITSAQEAKIEQKLQNLSQHPCALVGRFGSGGRGALSGLSGARQAILSAVAGALKLKSATLQSDLAAGKTISQLASAQGVQLSAVNTAYLNAVQAQLNQAVTNQLITQTQATNIYNKVKQAVANGHYPLLEGRKMGGTGRSDFAWSAPSISFAYPGAGR
jgi:hypothetical protein